MSGNKLLEAMYFSYIFLDLDDWQYEYSKSIKNYFEANYI
jgi:hypothetical protein